ncbi:hypothetical protein CXF87_10620 [Halomonas sp. MES3-P3E]|nr:hypothetical protein CXF87_10620 [Halomonas sp. MES3-P3E]
MAKGEADVLLMQFDDVVPGEGFGCEEPMTLEDAWRISGWIRQWTSDRRSVKIVVHCTVGVSQCAVVDLWAGASINRPAQGVEEDGRDANPHVRSMLDRTAA